MVWGALKVCTSSVASSSAYRPRQRLGSVLAPLPPTDLGGPARRRIRELPDELVSQIASQPIVQMGDPFMWSEVIGRSNTGIDAGQDGNSTTFGKFVDFTGVPGGPKRAEAGGEKGVEAADKVVPNFLIADLDSAAKAESTEPSTAAMPAFAEDSTMPTPQELQATIDRQAAEIATLKANQLPANFAERETRDRKSVV